MQFALLQLFFTLASVGQLILHSAADSKLISKSYHKRSDDQCVIESLSRQLSETNAKIAASEVKIAALEAKLDKVQQTSVAFHAEFSNDPVTLGPEAPVIFNVALTNIANGYDTLTGHFKAPVSGTYMFVVNFMGALRSTLYVYMYVDNNLMAYSISHSDNTWDHVSENLVVHLNASQRVRLANGHAYQVDIRGHHWSTFSGFLIHADP